MSTWADGTNVSLSSIDIASCVVSYTSTPTVVIGAYFSTKNSAVYNATGNEVTIQSAEPATAGIETSLSLSGIGISAYITNDVTIQAIALSTRYDVNVIGSYNAKGTGVTNQSVSSGNTPTAQSIGNPVYSEERPIAGFASYSIISANVKFYSGGTLSISGDVATVNTYYLRGWDSNGNNVYWSSVSAPDTTPSITSPLTIGTLSNVCIVGVVNH